ncbi:MAG TPA: hypothetical protein PKA10_02590 [Selenomonadales bacterium]|nr:hypothetical protein [Selenomonadales bacterium]
MLRRLLIYTLVIVFTLPLMVSAQSTAEMTVLDKTTVLEKILYGTEQTSSIVERIGKMERDLHGAEFQGALVDRADTLYGYVKDSSAGTPSFITKLSAVEWTLTHAVTTQPAKARLDNLERVMLGNNGSGSFDDRLNKLMKLAFPDGQIEVAGVTVDKDTLVKIRMTTPLTTKSNRVGDAVAFEVAEDVYVGDILVLGRGAQGIGKVSKVEPARNFGRDAKLEIAFNNLEAMDGTSVETFLGEKAKEETKSLAKAAGATVAGLVILGPVGVIGGAFVQGQDITIPAGTELYIQTKMDTEVYGVRTR